MVSKETLDQLHIDDFMETYIDEFDQESSRATALICGAYLDSMLEKLLKTHFTKEGHASKNRIENLFGPTAPLGTFSGRIGIAHALGFIQRSDITKYDAIRKIRNHFAHHPLNAKFTDAVPNKQMNKFSNPQIDKMYKKIGGPPEKEMKSRFTLHVNFYVSTLTFHIEKMNPDGEWPYR